ncbi:MAG: hypothetical protein J2P56_06190, partial [Verrucomicrobia bacterium]|nr:hypothetical protein [Verrucomicrobiota bacterium]
MLPDYGGDFPLRPSINDALQLCGGTGWLLLPIISTAFISTAFSDPAQIDGAQCTRDGNIPLKAGTRV